MKVTKRQLTRIIKEEKAKLQENFRAESNAERAVGIYADIPLIGKVRTALNELEGQVFESAFEDLEDEDDAAEQTKLVIAQVIAGWASDSGYVGIEQAIKSAVY